MATRTGVQRMNDYADAVYMNGRITTLGSSKPQAEALAVKDCSILQWDQRPMYCVTPAPPLHASLAAARDSELER